MRNLFIIGVLLIGLGAALSYEMRESKRPNVQQKAVSAPIFTSPLPTIAGIVVPHHDLVKAQRAALFANVVAQGASPKTVILVSPNHYNVGKAVAQTTERSWQAAEGDIAPNLEVI